MTASTGGGVRILLVEDSRADVELLLDVLADSPGNYAVDVVGDGDAALAYLHGGDYEGTSAARVRPDLVILDLNLPRRSGREVLAAIRADDQLRTLPVIVLTTSTQPDDRRACYELQANCVIIKPIELDDFDEVVRAIERLWFGVGRGVKGGAGAAAADQYRAMVEHADDIISRVDVAGRVEYISPAFQRLLGYTPDDLIGRDGLFLVHPDDRGRLRRVTDAVAFGSAGDARIEYRVLTAAKRWLWVESAIRPISEKGNTIGLILVARDISERKLHEAAMSEAHELFRAAFEDAPIGMALTAIGDSMDGRFVRVNRAFAATHGLTIDEMMARTWPELMHPDDMPGVLASRERLARGEIKIDRREVRMRGPADWRWVELTRSILYDDQREPLYVLGQHREIAAPPHRDDDELDDVSPTLSAQRVGLPSPLP